MESRITLITIFRRKLPFDEPTTFSHATMSGLPRTTALEDDNTNIVISGADTKSELTTFSHVTMSGLPRTTALEDDNTNIVISGADTKSELTTFSHVTMSGLPRTTAKEDDTTNIDISEADTKSELTTFSHATMSGLPRTNALAEDNTNILQISGADTESEFEYSDDDEVDDEEIAEDYPTSRATQCDEHFPIESKWTSWENAPIVPTDDPPFTNNESGPKVDVPATPFGCVKLFLTDDFIAFIVEQTNLYVEHYLDNARLGPFARAKQWKPLTSVVSRDSYTVDSIII